MKKLSLLLAVMLCVSLFAACGGSGGSGSSTPEGQAQDGQSPAGESVPAGGAELRVVTSYGGDDGNRGNYETALKTWEAATGNAVKDESATSNEQWKAKVLNDFDSGSEPDVLFFFSGMDANPFVEAGKVVPLEEIRAEYPDYAANMDDAKIGASPVDGKLYAVPTNGYWEGLFVNKTVLAQTGAAMPGPDTTWEEFLAICQTIKDAGYTPIAVSLAEVPHYWFEFCVLNNGSYKTHETVPAGPDDPVYQNWVNGLGDIKELYDRGFLPANTNTSTDAEAWDLMANDEAAFAVDGSWKMGWFTENNLDTANYTVTFVPGKGERAATDMIGGLSMGYYITRKTWDDPEKREAAVSFVQHMTTDENVNIMAGGTAVTALKAGTAPPAESNSLIDDAIAMLKVSTGTVAAVQDKLTGDAKQVLLPDNMKRVSTGEITAEASIDEALAKM